jgi:hypothetical protein
MYAWPIDFDLEPEDRYTDDYAPDVCDCERCRSAVPLAA